MKVRQERRKIGMANCQLQQVIWLSVLKGLSRVNSRHNWEEAIGWMNLLVFSREKDGQGTEPSIYLLEMKMLQWKLQNTNGKATSSGYVRASGGTVLSTFSNAKKEKKKTKAKQKIKIKYQYISINSSASQGTESLSVSALVYWQKTYAMKKCTWGSGQLQPWWFEFNILFHLQMFPEGKSN